MAMDLKARREILALRASPGGTATLVFPGSQAPPAPPAPPESVNPAPLAARTTLPSLSPTTSSPESEEPASQAIPGQLAPLVPPAPLVLLVIPAPLVPRGTKAPLVSLGKLVLRALRDLLVLLVQWAPLEKMGNLEGPDGRESAGCLAPRA